MKKSIFIISGLLLIGTGLHLIYGSSAHELMEDLPIEKGDYWFSPAMSMIGAGIFLIIRSLIGKGIRIW